VNTSGLFDLSGRVICVTGAAWGGLGGYSALALAEMGCRLALSDHEDARADLEATAERVRALGAECSVVLADVTSEADVEKLAAAAAELGEVSGLAHHAGVMLRRPALDTTRGEWDRILSINLTGAWLVNKAIGRLMIDGAGGSICNVASIYATVVGPLPESAYYASKAGVANMSRGLAMEWASAGVRVNCLAPGTFYPTRMTAPLAEDPERLDSMARRTMLGRLGDPSSDLAGAVAFLMAPASAYITAEVIHVDGGWSSW